MTDKTQWESAPPGSDDAIAQGCTCPVLDNGRGAGAYGGSQPGVFWISAACPLHQPKPESPR